MADIERRSVATEVRAVGRTLKGYAAVFNRESHDLGAFREIIRPGALDRALREGQDVIARAHHCSEHLLGRTSSGTLRLKADAHGLAYEVDTPDTTPGRDTAVLEARGDIRKSSFAFMVEREGLRWTDRASDGLPLRELLEISLLVDVAPVVDPAYPIPWSRPEPWRRVAW